MCCACCWVQGLLRREQQRRLGAGGDGLERLQAHAFFLGLGWEQVSAREITPEYVPPVEGEEDVGNFEHVFTREEAVDSKVVDKTAGGGGDGGLFSVFPFNIIGGKGGGADDGADDDPDFPGFTFNGTAGPLDG